MPTKIPMDHLNYTSGDHSIAEITEDFRGNFHMSADINDLAVEFMKANHVKRGFGDYKTDFSGANIVGSLDPKFIRD